MDERADKRSEPTWLLELAGTSELGRLVAEYDWAATPLGHPDTWPAHLRFAVEICLRSPFPMLVAWGPDLVKIYNDGYRSILGDDKHPKALGARSSEIWPEIWDTIGPLFAEVLAGGTVWAEHQRLEVDRSGFLEECFFTYSYSPLPGDDGVVGGVLDVVTETTDQVIAGRRLECVSGLAAELVTADAVTEVCRRAVVTLRACADDVVSAEVYLRAGDQLVRVATSRRQILHGTDSDDLDQVLDDGEGRLLDHDWTPGRPARRWAGPVGTSGAHGVLVVDLSPKRPFDDGYRSFLELVSRTVGAAVDNAYRQSVELGEQRQISDALQGAMLQPASDLPTVAARYLPATGNLSVGGDWYDVLRLEDGRRALVVGDCVGHGLEAAVAMGQLRTASRALLLEGGGPAEVLESMDRFATSVVGAACATMVCAVVDLDGRTITYATAGHLPPLLVGARDCRWLDGQGLPLAVEGSDDVRRETTATFVPGDLLVLYTDGLVERRGEDIDVGLDRLRRAASARFHQTVQELADGLLDDLGDPEGRDDVAFVVKRLMRTGPPQA